MKLLIILSAFLLSAFVFIKAGEKQQTDKIQEFTAMAYDVEAVFRTGNIVHHAYTYTNQQHLVEDIRRWIRENENNRVKLIVDGAELDLGFRSDFNRMYYIISVPSDETK